MSLPFFLQPVLALVPPSPSSRPQHFFHILKLHLQDSSPCFKMRIEAAGPCSLEGSLAICYTLPCSVLTLPSFAQFLGKLCGLHSSALLIFLFSAFLPEDYSGVNVLWLH